MKEILHDIWLIVFCCLVAYAIGYSVANAQSATVSLRIPCTNENHAYSPLCKPVDFYETRYGFAGTLANGETFTQEWVTRNMMLFQGDEMKWLVYKDKVVYLD